MFECKDFLSPNWEDFDKKWKAVHEWKTYCHSELRGIWHTFTEEQKKVIAKNLQIIADDEEWD